MLEQKVVIEVNSNFHHIAGEDFFSKNDGRFKEYRKKWTEWPRNFYTGNFPLFIDVEVTNVCNLKCPFCATTHRKRTAKKGYISAGIMKKIIDEGADNNLYGIKFNIRGEPLLHPQIHEFVEYAKRKGLIDVYFNTNGMPLTPEVSRRLIDAGLDRISISVEGFTKDMYEKYRVGAEFDTVLSNVEALQALKDRLCIKHPKVRVQTVMLPELEADFEAYKEFWAGRVDEVAFIDYKEMRVKKKGIRCAWACPQVWQRMAVFWDGTILPCNHDDEGLLALGNVRDVSIKETWHSERLAGVRSLHKRGVAHQIEACDGCQLRDSEISKILGVSKGFGEQIKNEKN